MVKWEMGMANPNLNEAMPPNKAPPISTVLLKMENGHGQNFIVPIILVQEGQQ